MENNAYAKFGRGNTEYYGIFEKGLFIKGKLICLSTVMTNATM